VNGSISTAYWRGPTGDPIFESSLTGANQEEYIFFNGERIARRDVASGAIHYYFSDHLGSHAVVDTVSSSGTITCDQDIDYYPYGGVVHDYCGSTPQHYRFTGKERDAESGNDYFGARYYGPNLARFMVPDPAGNAVADPANPQSWNLYAYVLNNPLSYSDPLGLFCAYLDDAGTGVGSIDANSDKDECGDNGGYWIVGDYGGGSWININAENGTVMGLGYDSNGNGEVSVAGAAGSNPWGAWTQTFNSPGLSQPTAANNGTLPNGDVPIYGLNGQGAQILKAAGDAAAYGLKCAGYGWAVQGTTMAASAPVIAKPFSTPGSSGGTSVASSLAGDYYGTSMTVPVGMPGTSSFRWTTTANWGRAAGRILPYVGTAVGAYAINSCLGGGS
jgi:RHS repeat-associated protein